MNTKLYIIRLLIKELITIQFCMHNTLVTDIQLNNSIFIGDI